MPTIEFEGKTTEEAIEKACNQLHLAKDELKFEILSTGTSGIFGLLTGKKACIKVMVEETLSTASESEKTRPSPRPSKIPASGQDQTQEKTARKPRRSSQKDPGKKRQTAESAKDREPVSEATTVQPGDLMLFPPTKPGPGEEVYQGPEGEAMTFAREVLEGILERMPVEASVAVSRINDRIILNIEGDSSGLLIGKKGATLDAFQFLVNKIVNRSRSDRNHIIVDTGNYRSRRHESLVSLAQRMANKARTTKRPVSINALSAHDRRIVHLALKNEPGLVTRSKGEGSFKKVVILPSRASQNRQNSKGHPARPANAEDLESGET
ncbi:MAG: Jag N-terminal domain-containing protein [Deltaproteobacteria bacterium]|nr:Jag N-terminal domain-containing protein [Deltaproteobacteria bacterium]